MCSSDLRTGDHRDLHLSSHSFPTRRSSDLQQLDADSVGDSLKLTVTRLGKAGINIDSVGDSVDLTLPEALDARMRITSVGDQIRGPGLRVSSSDDFETTFGKGGPMIRIDSVGDSVVIHDGPPLTRTLNGCFRLGHRYAQGREEPIVAQLF